MKKILFTLVLLTTSITMMAQAPEQRDMVDMLQADAVEWSDM